jgi:hypothetical protein
LEDHELIAERLSEVSEQVRVLENRLSDVLTRVTDVEKVDARLEEASLIMARALAEISEHWDAVYESMRRKNHTEEAAER